MMRRWLVRNGVQGVLQVMASLARVRGTRSRHTRMAIEALGTAVAHLRKVQRRPDADPATLGATWQSAFPARKQVPIVGIDEDTAFGEIHTPCPLRGSGDVDACYRMMGYDRAFMRCAGARFVVLRSQAEPNVTVCKIAIRRADLPANDLIPADVLARTRKRIAVVRDSRYSCRQ
jgi:hypothetical protein